MKRLAVLGGGNLGRALALGWVGAGRLKPADIRVTRRQADKLQDLAALGFQTGSDNRAAIRDADVVVIAVQPQQLDDLLAEIGRELEPERHRLISVVTGVSIAQIRAAVGCEVPLVLAMPNTAVQIGESMTCLAAGPGSEAALEEARELFDLVGRTLVIQEEMMAPATALCACGVAFFLRCVRAASQGGIEIGFHPEEALLLAAQTARGAASLTLRDNSHPEGEIDRVTTPRGCTIAGLNEMEHRGLSSAMIKGLIVSARAAERLYQD
ncbi:MAG TPA: pyrroline-5-carboxylate reductase [Longimicrobiales bacterium]|nr:pyrroline-5-carboxylate reductase [Longimicrobiales bacterium]